MKEKGFQLRVSPHAQHINRGFIVSFVSLILLGLIILQRVIFFNWGIWQLLALVLILGLFVLLLLMNLYFYRIYDLQGSAIVFGEKEWKDSISLPRLGVGSLTDIKDAKISTYFGLGFLEILLTDEAGKKLKSGWVGRLYYRVFGLRLLIPLYLLDISRLDLESQFLHLTNILGRAGSNRFEKDFQQMLESQAVSLDSKPASKHRSIFSALSSSAEKLDDKSTHHPVLKEVEQKKAQFFERHLDTLLCELFFDSVRHFPKKVLETSELPSEIRVLNHRREGAEYEEVEFEWGGVSYQMGLRKNLDESTEALLSLAVDQDVKVSLKVEVEIGTLAPKDLERYLEGAWEEELKRLEKRLKTPVVPPEQKEAGKEGSAPQSQDTAKLEELKKNFGLKD